MRRSFCLATLLLLMAVSLSAQTPTPVAQPANVNSETPMQIVMRTFKAGNDALVAKSYDEAIKSYDEGLAADPAQPALLTNKSVAYKARAVDRYNAAILSKDEDAKKSGLEAAKQDFRAAVEAASKSVELLKAQPVPTDPAALASLTNNKLAAFSTRADGMRLFVTKVDQSQADAGLTAYREYIALETDPAKKSKAQHDVAQMLLDAGESAKALAEFQKTLSENPDDPDANLGAGVALFSMSDNRRYQDAADYLQRFIDVAPATHKFRQNALDILTNLKETEKIVPQKRHP